MQEVGELPPSLDLRAVTAEPPRELTHGDISTNAAMVLSKSVGRTPRVIAELLATHLRNNPEVENVEVAGPGFVNLRLNSEFWRTRLKEVLAAGPGYGNSVSGEGRKVNLEYVSANPTGPLHVAHARGAVVGDALANLLLKVGYNVTKEYYINDAGAQVDNLGRALYLRFLEKEGFILSAFPDRLYPGDYVKEIAEKFYLKPKLKHLLPLSLGRKDQSNTHLSNDLTKILSPSFPHSSLRQVSATFKNDSYSVGVGFNEAAWLPVFREFAVDRMLVEIESDLRDLGVEFGIFSSEKNLVNKGAVARAFNELKRQGLVYQGRLDPPKGKVPDDWEDREQTLFRATNFGDEVDRPLKKSDGSWTYFANDIAYHHDKFRRGFLDMIDVWGADHGGYVKRMKAAVTAITKGEAQLDVKLCQLVRVMRDGELMRMSKRAGTFVTLRDLLKEVDADVVRFTMLTRKNDAPFDFDLTKAVEQSRDNLVWYVQYAHARTRSVMRSAKSAGNDTDNLKDASLDQLVDEGELSLIRLIAQWPRQVEAAATAHEPHRLAFYLNDLAGAFHTHWNRGGAVRFVVEGELELTRARLALVQAISFVIESGLKVFGVTPAEEI